jgi:hypothetical protein
VLLVPVVVRLIDIALGVVLLDLAETRELAVVLRLQGVDAIEGTRCPKDVTRVLLSGRQLVLEPLLP